MPCRLLLLIVLALPNLSSAGLPEAHSALESGHYRKAVREFTALAKQGDTEAQFQLARLYAQGRGVSRDYAQTAKWMRQAAEQGHAEAQMNMGVMAQRGINGPKSDEQAFRWYLLSAEQGFAAAQSNLGTLYANGEGTPADQVKASYWYERAAEQGIAISQHNTSIRYAKGTGVAIDEQKAHAWNLKAAEQRFPGALHNLGFRYVWGKGVAKSYVIAYALLSLAAEGEPGTASHARDRRAIEADLSVAQKQEGLRLAAIIRNSKSLLQSLAQYEQEQRPQPLAQTPTVQLDLTTPENTLAGYIEALRSGDSEGVQQHYLGGGFKLKRSIPIQSYEIEEKKVYGQREVNAWVALPAAKIGDVELTVHQNEPNRSDTYTYLLRNQNGEWKIFSHARWDQP